MLAGMVGISVLCGLLSVAVAALTGQSPLFWPLFYVLAGTCGALAVSLHAAKGFTNGGDALE